MLAGLLFQPLPRFEQVPVGGPRMRRAPWDLAVAEVARSGAAMTRGDLELLGGLVVQPGRRFEPLVQFQTLTSR